MDAITQSIIADMETRPGKSTTLATLCGATGYSADAMERALENMRHRRQVRVRMVEMPRPKHLVYTLT